MDLFIHWLAHAHQKRTEETALGEHDDEACHLEHHHGNCDPIAELEQWTEFVVEQRDGEVTPQEVTETQHSTDTEMDLETGLAVSSDNNSRTDTNHEDHSHQQQDEETGIDESEEALKQSMDENQEKAKLVHMGLSTAVAIGLHNFPEGLASFVAALSDVRVGFVFALAIAIHNIPEGLCVALPVYYGTGSRRKAFLWACISGISEPFGALLGYFILINRFTPTVYAILFGIVAGMMVFIVIKEIIPTAHRYDPEDTVVSYCVILGMAIMAISLVLFAL